MAPLVKHVRRKALAFSASSPACPSVLHCSEAAGAPDINHILSSIISVLSCGGGVALKSTFMCTGHCWMTAPTPSFFSYHFILRWPICVVVTTPLPLFFVSPLSFPDRYFYFFPTLSPKWKEHTFSEWFICIGPQFTFDIDFIFVVYLSG